MCGDISRYILCGLGLFFFKSVIHAREAKQVELWYGRHKCILPYYLLSTVKSALRCRVSVFLGKSIEESYDARKKTSFCRPVFTACEIKKEKRQEKGRVKKLALAAAAAAM